MRYYLIISLALCLFIVACSTSKKTPSTATAPVAEVSYKKSILPIIESKCAVSGCHVQGFYEGDFTIFEVVKKQADKGKLRRLVVENKSMPPDQPLPSNEIKLIDTWIQQGAKNN